MLHILRWLVGTCHPQGTIENVYVLPAAAAAAALVYLLFPQRLLLGVVSLAFCFGSLVARLIGGAF